MPTVHKSPFTKKNAAGAALFFAIKIRY